MQTRARAQTEASCHRTSLTMLDRGVIVLVALMRSPVPRSSLTCTLCGRCGPTPVFISTMAVSTVTSPSLSTLRSHLMPWSWRGWPPSVQAEYFQAPRWYCEQMYRRNQSRTLLPIGYHEWMPPS